MTQRNQSSQQESVWERLEKQIKEYHYTKHVRRNPEAFNLHPTCDATTGQPLFKPHLISKNVNTNTTVQSVNEPKWEVLYQEAKRIEMRKKQTIEKLTQE